MKKVILSLALLVIGAFALSQEVEILAVADYEDPSGFSGYGWGSSYDFIRQDMEEEGYELTYSTNKDLWYRGNINGEWLQIVYYFEHGVLTSGMFVMNDVDQPSFWVVNEYLQEMYGAKVELTFKNDDWIEAEMADQHRSWQWTSRCWIQAITESGFLLNRHCNRCNSVV